MLPDYQKRFQSAQAQLKSTKQTQSSIGEFASSAINQVGKGLYDFGAGALGLAKTAALAPVGAFEAPLGLLMGNSEMVERGVERVAAPGKMAGGMIKMAAYDLPKQFGEGAGKLAYGSTLAPFQRGMEEATAIQKEGLTDVAKSLGTAAAFLPTGVGQVASAALTQSARGVEENLTPAQTLGNITGQSTVQYGLFKALERYGTKQRTQKPSTMRARMSGLADDDIGAISDMANINKNYGQKVLEVANKAKIDKKAVRPMEVVGQDFASSVDKIDEFINGVGKKIGEIKKTIRTEGVGKFSVKPTRSSIFQQFNKDGIRVKIGNKLYDFSDELADKIAKSKDASLVFDNSTIALNSADQSMAQFIFEKMKSGTINVEDAPNLITALQNKIYSSKGEIVGGKAYTEALRRGIREQVNQFADDIGKPELINLNEAFHESVSVSDDLRMLVGPEGTKSPAVLRRAFSNTGYSVKETLAKMDELATKYGIEGVDTNLLSKANFAETVESAMKIPAPLGFEGAVKTGVEAAKSGRWISMGLDFVGDQTLGRIIGSPEVNIARLLSRPSSVTLPSRLESLMKTLGKMRKPKSINQRIAIPKAQNQGMLSGVGRGKTSGIN